MAPTQEFKCTFMAPTQEVGPMGDTEEEKLEK